MTFWDFLSSSVLLVFGIVIGKILESRPKLIAFFSSVSAGRIVVDGDGQPIGINTHTIVVVNKGSMPALNVRLGHRSVFPSVRNVVAIFPPQDFAINIVPAAGEEIVFERILPKQSISITYIYHANITVNDINTYVRSDEAEAKFWPVEIQRKYPRWYLLILLGLMVLGAATLLYFIYHYGVILLAHLKPVFA